MGYEKAVARWSAWRISEKREEKKNHIQLKFSLTRRKNEILSKFKRIFFSGVS